MKNRNYFLFFGLLLLLSSCAGSDIEAQADYFPNADGNWWEYQYSDSLTMRLELSGTETIESTEIQKLIWNYEAETDTNYILKKETEIILYTQLASWSAFILARFPLEEGNSWQAFRIVITGVDTITITANVEGKQNISVPAGEFEDCYPIYYENQSLEEPMRIYFAPDIGPVKFEYATGREEVLVDYEVE